MKTLLLSLLFLTSAAAFSQEFKLGNVSIKEINEKSHGQDPAAPAAILHKKGNTYFDFDNEGSWVVVTDVSVRMKIYNEEGKKYATVEVPYEVTASIKEDVEFISAATFNAAGSKVGKTKFTGEGSTTEIDGQKIKKITLPDVKAGSVIEYRYILRSNDITRLPNWYFQSDIPVNNIEYAVRIPHYFVYNRVLSPYFPVQERQETDKVSKQYSNYIPKGTYGKSNAMLQNEEGQIAYTEVSTIYTAQNVPALKNAPYVDNIRNYQSYIQHELARAQYPGQAERQYAGDWRAVVKAIYNDLKFGTEINTKSYFEKDLDALLKGVSNRDEIIAAIFNYVRDRMTWNGEYGYITQNGVKQAYAKKTGNVGDINLMLINMLRYAGLNANPVLLSTRDNGHKVFINREAFNYVIAGVEVQNGIVYLDATSKNTAPGLLPVRALSGKGRLVRENLTSDEVDLMPSGNSKENALVVATILPDGSVTGQVKTQYFDYNALVYRENILSRGKEAYAGNLENELKDTKVSGLEITDDKDAAKPVVEHFTFNSNSLCEVRGDKLYVSPMLFYAMAHNPLNEESRPYPVDFVYPHQDRYTLSINLPEGYVVESVPAATQLVMQDNIGIFRYNIAAKDKQVQVVVSKDINYARVSPDYYSALKKFYADMVNKQNEKIVLKKA